MRLLKKYKTNIIVCIVISIVLLCTFFMGNNSQKQEMKSVGLNQNSISEHITKKEISDEMTGDTGKTKGTEAPSETENPKETEVPKETEKSESVSGENEGKETHDKTEEPYEKNEKEAEKENELICTISVRCDTILDNFEMLDTEKRGLVPDNGVILAERKVSFSEGESAFDVLVREMRNNKIHLEFVKTPMYNDVYIEGISNIYEFDCGELSGWMYCVNGVFSKHGSGSYILKNGDKLEWIYTCDLGKDIGGGYIKGN